MLVSAGQVFFNCKSCRPRTQLTIRMISPPILVPIPRDIRSQRGAASPASILNQYLLPHEKHNADLRSTKGHAVRIIVVIFQVLVVLRVLCALIPAASKPCQRPRHASAKARNPSYNRRRQQRKAVAAGTPSGPRYAWWRACGGGYNVGWSFQTAKPEQHQTRGER
jgi:hypothetical protein